jgi:hypothetical protein
MRSALVTGLMLAMVGPVAAQPDATAPAAAPAIIQPAEPLAEPSDPPQPEALSPRVGLALSLGSTAASYVMFGAVASADFGNNHLRDQILGAVAIGTFAGPTLGHWYARRAGSPGLIARAVGVGLVYWGLSSFDIAPCLACKDRDDRLGVAAVALGLGTYAVATVYDVIDAPRAVRRRNERVRGLPVRPLIGRGLGGNTSVGLALSGRF